MSIDDMCWSFCRRLIQFFLFFNLMTGQGVSILSSTVNYFFASDSNMSRYDISYTPDSSRVEFMMTRLNQPFYVDAATADKFTVMSAEQPEVFKDLMNNIETEKFRQTSKICEAA